MLLKERQKVTQVADYSGITVHAFTRSHALVIHDGAPSLPSRPVEVFVLIALEP